jgi:hypothetical protein
MRLPFLLATTYLSMIPFLGNCMEYSFAQLINVHHAMHKNYWIGRPLTPHRQGRLALPRFSHSTRLSLGWLGNFIGKTESLS